ncbi:thioredoxin family protein [Deltaproteobacteria bacterium TL4]
MLKNQNPSVNKNKPSRINKRFLQSGLTLGLLGALVYGLFFWNQGDAEYDLSLIGKGKNVVVQVHDPNCPYCRKLKRVVNSLQPEYENQILFLTADVTTEEGRWFAEYHNVEIVTLVFFKPDGRKITTLQGVQEADYLRRAFNRAFQLQR